MSNDLSVLGLGSNNTLNSDLINKLKDAQLNATISPIEHRQETNLLKKEAIETIRDKFSELHTQLKVLTDESSFETMDVYSDSSNVGFEITDQEALTDDDKQFKLNVLQLAQEDVYQTNKVTNLEEPIIVVNSSFTINVGGTDYAVDLTSTDTYMDLKDKLLGVPGVIADFIKVSENDEYRLRISSIDKGESNTISFSNITPELDTVLGLTNVDNHILTAQNSKVEFNGIEVERTTNEVHDLVPGLAMNFFTEGEIDVQIQNDVTLVAEGYENFINEYNATIETINSFKSNLEEGEKSVIFGINELTSGLRNMKNALFSFRREADIDNPEEIKSIFQAGFNFTESGSLIKNQIRKVTELPEALGGGNTIENINFIDYLSTNPEIFKDFFTSEDSPFQLMRTEMNKIVNLDSVTDTDGNIQKGSFETLLQKYDTDDTKYTERIEQMTQKIDLEYEQMTAKFAQYDTIMANMTNSFSAMDLMIKQSTSSN